MSGLDGRDRATVDVSYDRDPSVVHEKTVFDSVTVTQLHNIQPTGNYETQYEIHAGDELGRQPEAVTERVAEQLWTEFSIAVEDEDGIEIVDMDDEDVRIK
jgi:hypothetical protein